MPIKGLTDRDLSFPEIGQIRKGAPKNEKGWVGKDLEYFRVEFDERERECSEIFRRTYGEAPQEIRIILPFNELDRMWQAWLEAYTASRLVARSDGETFIYWVDPETGVVKASGGEPRLKYQDGMSVGKDQSGKPIFCKPTGRLRVIIPELARAAYLTLLTTSYHDVANISQQLKAFQTLNNGIIAGIPLILRRRPKKISRPTSDGGRVRTTKWLISIEADPRWVKMKLAEVKHLALPGNGINLFEDDEEELQDEYITSTAQYIDDEEETDIPSAPDMEPQILNVDITQSEKTKTKKSERPASPELVKEGIDKYTKQFAKSDDFTPSIMQRNLLRYGLELCFDGQEVKVVDDKRHALLKYLIGTPSTKEATGPQFKAIIEKWLEMKENPDGSGEYMINKYCPQEAESIVAESLIEEGQQKLDV